jgi:hypothetical protein
MSLKIFLQCLLCGILFWTAFCRIVKTSHRTRNVIRWSFSLLAVASLLLALTPWAYRWFPILQRQTINWTELLMLFAFCCVQVSTAVYWRRGQPDSFRKDAP